MLFHVECGLCVRHSGSGDKEPAGQSNRFDDISGIKPERSTRTSQNGAALCCLWLRLTPGEETTPLSFLLSLRSYRQINPSNKQLRVSPPEEMVHLAAGETNKRR